MMICKYASVYIYLNYYNIVLMRYQNSKIKNILLEIIKFIMCNAMF